MRKGYRVTLSILTIMILFTITVGTSYSYYSITDVQTESNLVVTTCFKIDFNDDNGSSTISLSSDGKYAYPMSDASALNKYTPYTFTITNNCTSTNAKDNINYVVTLNTLTNNPSNLTYYLKYKLNTVAPTASTGTTTYLTENVYDLNANIKTEQGIDASYGLTSGSLAPGESKTYSLYMWIDENAGNDVMGKTFEGKLLVYSYM